MLELQSLPKAVAVTPETGSTSGEVPLSARMPGDPDSFQSAFDEGERAGSTKGEAADGMIVAGPETGQTVEASGTDGVEVIAVEEEREGHFSPKAAGDIPVDAREQGVQADNPASGVAPRRTDSESLGTLPPAEGGAVSGSIGDGRGTVAGKSEEAHSSQSELHRGALGQKSEPEKGAPQSRRVTFETAPDRRPAEPSQNPFIGGKRLAEEPVDLEKSRGVRAERSSETIIPRVEDAGRQRSGSGTGVALTAVVGLSAAASAEGVTPEVDGLTEASSLSQDTGAPSKPDKRLAMLPVADHDGRHPVLEESAAEGGSDQAMGGTTSRDVAGAVSLSGTALAPARPGVSQPKGDIPSAAPDLDGAGPVVQQVKSPQGAGVAAHKDARTALHGKVVAPSALPVWVDGSVWPQGTGHMPDTRGAIIAAPSTEGIQEVSVMQDLGKGLQNPVPRATSAPMTPMAEGRALPSPISANPAVTSAMIATHSRATQGGVAPGATLATKPAPASAQNTQASVFGMVETSIMRQGPDRDFGYVAQRAEDTPVLRFYQSGDTRPVPNAEQVSMAAPAAKSPRQPGPGLILPVSDKVARQADHDRATVSDPLGLSEARPGADTSAVRAGIEGSPTPHRAVEIARQIATQIALPSRSGSGPQAIEITLSPIELGRVRVTLLPGDTTMAVSILADRPETIELMRRHVDVLAQEFRDMGYDGAAFSFDGQGGARGGDAGSPSASDRRDRGPGDDTPLPDNALTTARARIVSDGLDIRL